MGRSAVTCLTTRSVCRLVARVLATLVIAALALLPSSEAWASTTLNVTGTYSSVYHCKTGWCAGQDFPATTVYRQAPGSSTVYDGTNAGTLNGNVLTIHEV